MAKVIPKKQPYQISVTLGETITKNPTLYTDSTNVYQRVISSYNRLSVNHSINEYVKGNVHTNTIEGAFSHFKRSIIGTFFHISPKHTQRYCDEFAAKYNSRKIKDSDRFVSTVSNCECRLKYRVLVTPIEQDYTKPIKVTVEKKPQSTGKGILQIKDGELVGHYTSLHHAATANGFDKANIRKVLRGQKPTSHGFVWIYA